MSEDKLNRFGKDKKVIELYKEGKTIREISSVVHMSVCNIGKIIKKYV